MQSNKEKYIQYCQKNAVPIFNQPWWWDAVCPNLWDVALVETTNNIIAAFPFHRKRKGLHTFILPPKLTQYTELILNYPHGQKYASKIGFEKEKINEIIAQFPKSDYIELTTSPSLTNWLPFKWNNFTETSRYTYVLDDLSDIVQVRASFKENIRREIKKGEKQLKITTTKEVDLFYKINQKTFDRQRIKNPYSLALFRKVNEACDLNNCNTIYVATDEKGNIHASVYIVWDTKTSYYLAGGSDPDFRTSGAHSLLMWEAIKDASKRNQSFDFKGSMIESVERFFRGFGAKQTPYFNLKKHNSKAVKILLELIKH